MTPSASKGRLSFQNSPLSSDVKHHHDVSACVNRFATTVTDLSVAFTMNADAQRYSCGNADHVVFNTGVFLYTTLPSAIQMVVPAWKYVWYPDMPVTTGSLAGACARATNVLESVTMAKTKLRSTQMVRGFIEPENTEQKKGAVRFRTAP